jgi:hypothetical protein
MYIIFHWLHIVWNISILYVTILADSWCSYMAKIISVLVLQPSKYDWDAVSMTLFTIFPSSTAFPFC